MRNQELEDRLAKRDRRVGEFIQALTEGRGAAGLEDGRVVRITIRLPTEEQPETLIVVKASTKGGDYVGFIGGLDVVQALLVWRAKDAKAAIRWREDVPWDQR